jgi:hypothetical protein
MNTQQNDFIKDDKIQIPIKYKRSVIEAMSGILFNDGHIPQTGNACNENTEMLRVFANFNYRVNNDGDDTFYNNFRTKELVNTKVCTDAPDIVKIFFQDACKAYNNRNKYFSIMEILEEDEEYNKDAIEAINNKHQISYERLDDISNALVPWVFYSYYPSKMNEEEILSINNINYEKKKLLWAKERQEEENI